jgi:hypothetical protein
LSVADGQLSEKNHGITQRLLAGKDLETFAKTYNSHCLALPLTTDNYRLTTSLRQLSGTDTDTGTFFQLFGSMASAYL